MNHSVEFHRSGGNSANLMPYVVRQQSGAQPFEFIVECHVGNIKQWELPAILTNKLPDTQRDLLLITWSQLRFGSGSTSTDDAFRKLRALLRGLQESVGNIGAAKKMADTVLGSLVSEPGFAVATHTFGPVPVVIDEAPVEMQQVDLQGKSTILGSLNLGRLYVAFYPKIRKLSLKRHRITENDVLLLNSLRTSLKAVFNRYFEDIAASFFHIIHHSTPRSLMGDIFAIERQSSESLKTKLTVIQNASLEPNAKGGRLKEAIDFINLNYANDIAQAALVRTVASFLFNELYRMIGRTPRDEYRKALRDYRLPGDISAENPRSVLLNLATSLADALSQPGSLSPDGPPPLPEAPAASPWWIHEFHAFGKFLLRVQYVLETARTRTDEHGSGMIIDTFSFLNAWSTYSSSLAEGTANWTKRPLENDEYGKPHKIRQRFPLIIDLARPPFVSSPELSRISCWLSFVYYWSASDQPAITGAQAVYSAQLSRKLVLHPDIKALIDPVKALDPSYPVSSAIQGKVSEIAQNPETLRLDPSQAAIFEEVDAKDLDRVGLFLATSIRSRLEESEYQVFIKVSEIYGRSFLPSPRSLRQMEEDLIGRGVLKGGKGWVPILRTITNKLSGQGVFIDGAFIPFFERTGRGRAFRFRYRDIVGNLRAGRTNMVNPFPPLR